MAADRPAKVEIPITAMLDMTFQMLIFFIMNFSPSDLEGQMALTLPVKSEPAARNEPPQVPNAGEDPKLPADLTVVVRTAHDGTNNGNISRITVRDRTGETVVPTLEALTAHLEKARNGLANKDEVLIEGDSQLKWARVVEVMDAARKAGFTAGFGVPPDLPRPPAAN
jgi:biopolymer transport protein ExbD